MIQNSNPANNQGAPNPMLRRNQGDDFLRLQDLFYLCLARWKWFVLSLFVTMGAAGYLSALYTECIPAHGFPAYQG